MVLSLISLGGVFCTNNIVYNDHHSDHPRELNADIMRHAHAMHCVQACKMNSVMKAVRMGKVFMQLLNMEQVSNHACNCNTLSTSNNAMLITKLKTTPAQIHVQKQKADTSSKM